MRIFALTLALALAAGSASHLKAEETTCTGLLFGVHDNVVVPQTNTCLLVNALVQGNIQVFGSLTVAKRVRVLGNVIGESGYGFVRIFGPGVAVDGAVQLTEGNLPSGLIGGPQVGDSLQYDANNGYLFVNGALIGGDLQMIGNFGGGDIRGNVIDGNLQCKENSPAPTGADNFVGGVKEDQCAAF